MKVSELPKGTNLTKVKVKLPLEILQKYQDYAGGKKEMWIVGGMMGDWFMSSSSPKNKKRRLYPMPIGVDPIMILEWDVVKVLD
jgi:hypothetical protein